jgi:hypothetical protein
MKKSGVMMVMKTLRVRIRIERMIERMKKNQMDDFGDIDFSDVS